MLKGFLLGSLLALSMASPLFAEPGDYKDLGGGRSEIGGMAALDGKLYIINQGTLRRVSDKSHHFCLSGAIFTANSLYS